MKNIVGSVILDTYAAFGTRQVGKQENARKFFTEGRKDHKEFSNFEKPMTAVPVEAKKENLKRRKGKETKKGSESDFQGTVLDQSTIFPVSARRLTVHGF
jgi:hypothetical protein